MAGTFLSDGWYRVAALRPRLREHARISRQRFRGKAWYIVHDPLTNRAHRFSPSAWWIAAQLDGGCTVDAAWQRALSELGDAAPSQEEVIHLLSQLHGADLLVSQASPASEELLERRGRQDRPKWIAGLLNPMSIRIPLWDPDLFLSTTMWMLRPLFGWWGLAAWLMVVLPALFLAGQHWAELTGNLSDRLLSGSNLAAMLLVFPLVKLLHELGHGYAVKARGGEVHEAGVMLLVFAPAPYVDASSSNAFRSKWYRAFVAAAGMLTELLLAAAALYLWLAVEPGLVRTIAFNVMMVAGISTLVFNGNPLLRYDGYYILCDLVEIPNLAQRANSYWGWLVRRYGFADRDAETPDASASERRWFLFYAPAAFVYRTGLALSIALFIANEYFFVGVVLALWSIAGMVLVPAFRTLRFLFASPALARRRTRALTVSALALSALTLFGAFVPLPNSSVSEGVVWVPQDAEVRAAGSGFVLRQPFPSMSRVTAGQLLVGLEDRALAARYREQTSKVAELEVQAVLDLANDRARAFQAREALQREQSVLADIEGRVAQLGTLAQSSGTFVRSASEDLPGSFVRRGDLLGYIVAPEQRMVRAVVAQDHIGMVRGHLEAVEVMLSDRVGEPCAGRIVRAVPQGDERLPSKALALEGGGVFVLDPRDPAGLRTLSKVFQLDIELNAAPRDLRIGTRAYVRFRFKAEPMFRQAARLTRQLFLARLHV
jgi:putative peptide zinc metalloprotease protein